MWKLKFHLKESIYNAFHFKFGNVHFQLGNVQCATRIIENLFSDFYHLSRLNGLPILLVIYLTMGRSCQKSVIFVLKLDRGNWKHAGHFHIFMFSWRMEIQYNVFWSWRLLTIPYIEDMFELIINRSNIKVHIQNQHAQHYFSWMNKAPQI